MLQGLGIVPALLTTQRARQLFVHANVAVDNDQNRTMLCFDEFVYCLKLLQREMESEHVEATLKSNEGYGTLSRLLARHDSPKQRPLARSKERHKLLDPVESTREPQPPAPVLLDQTHRPTGGGAPASNPEPVAAPALSSPTEAGDTVLTAHQVGLIFHMLGKLHPPSDQVQGLFTIVAWLVGVVQLARTWWPGRLVCPRGTFCRRMQILALSP